MKPPHLSKAVFRLIKTALLAFVCCVRVSLAAEPHILLQSTTSTLNSGLYDHLLPVFTDASGIESGGRGRVRCLRNAANCDGDAVLAHAPEDELAFMKQGYGLARLPVMENRFVLLGPGEDPAGIKAAGTISEALRLIADKELRFLSRGDYSGTHQRERALWAEAGIDISTAEGSWYLEAGQGMGASINLAVQLNAYLLSDISTWLAFGNKADHQLLYNSEEAGLINRYSVITLNPALCPTVNHDGARQFADWLTAEAGQRQIASFRLDGQQMFTPYSRADK